jgi:GT2 family glycosyltransferase
MERKIQIAVVILNWNGKAFLEQFLPSVVKCSEASAEIVVVDNASSDGSVSFLEQYYPGIRLIQNAENGGFSKGYNDGLSQIEADYYVLLNSDVEVSDGWIEPVIAMMEADPSIGACQPKLRSFHERDKFEYAGAAGGFIDAYGYPFCRGRIFDVLEVDQGQYDDACEIFWATGACLFVRADLYHTFGGLDEDFFAHMEEIDFCWRLKNAGYKVMFCPESTVYHVGGGSLPKSSPRKTYLNFRNNLFLLVKNLPSKRLGWVLFIRYFLDMFAAVNFLLKGSWADAQAVCSAHWHFLRSFPRFVKKRRSLSQQDVGQVYWGSIVFDHFLGGDDVFSKLKLGKWE